MKGAGGALGRGQCSPRTQLPKHVVAARGKGELVACTSSEASGRAAADDRGRQGAAELGGLGKANGWMIGARKGGPTAPPFPRTSGQSFFTGGGLPGFPRAAHLLVS